MPDDPGTTGDWSIRSVSPSEGLIDITNVVELRGSFPSPAYVWFGDQPGTVLLQTPDLILALTPARSTPGTVNVELRQRGVGSVATMLSGYTFVDPFVAPHRHPRLVAPSVPRPPNRRQVRSCPHPQPGRWRRSHAHTDRRQRQRQRQRPTGPR